MCICCIDYYWNVAHVISVQKPRITVSRRSHKTDEDEDFLEEGTFAVSLMRKMDAADDSENFGFFIYQVSFKSFI